MPKNPTNHRSGHGFFNTDLANKAKPPFRKLINEQVADYAPKKKQLVNVGGQGDCGFRALAAGMVDNIFANERIAHATAGLALLKANAQLCERLIGVFVAQFPHYKEDVPKGQWTSVQILERMRHKQGFIPDLAFALRQTAVDEIVLHPEDYRGAFVNYSESEHPELTLEDQQTSPIKMRQLTTWIDESAIAAVAKVFNVPVTVRVTKANEELFKPMHYGPDAVSSAVMKANEIPIRLEANHYQPMLADPDAFAAVISQSAFTQKPAPAEVDSHDPSLDEVLAKIKAADKKLVADFSEYHAHLRALVDEGRLNKKQLLEIYIHGLNKPNNSGYLAGRVRQVGLEYGNQDFFERAVKNAGSEKSLTRSDPNDPLDVIIVDELVHAIARAMATTHDLSPDEVFAQIEADIPSVSPR